MEDQFARVRHICRNRQLSLYRRDGSRLNFLPIERVESLFRLLIVEADFVILGLCRQQVRVDEIGPARRKNRTGVDKQFRFPDFRAC